jgi:hypothetical protein
MALTKDLKNRLAVALGAGKASKELQTYLGVGDSFKAALSQISTTPVIQVQKTGNFVKFDYPAGSVTSAAAANISVAAGAIPLAYRPAVDKSFLVRGTDNAAKTTLTLTIKADGSIVFGVGATQANFTSSAAAGFDAGCVQYSIL